ncbi:MAG: hypothetical protein O7D91_17560 [Planctomycetota bacterium]|nr:hypothetical protein [Planctomycetota bacterium]
MKIVRAYPRIIAVTNCGRKLDLKIILNLEDSVLEVLAPSGHVLGCASNIEGLQQVLMGMPLDAADLGDDDGN